MRSTIRGSAHIYPRQASRASQVISRIPLNGCELIVDAMAHDGDMLNITQSDGDGEGEALAAIDTASSLNQSRISRATDVASPVLLLQPSVPNETVP